ncbi:circadian clock-controlled protein daywake [Halyomorpha halys]|uniref:circadian clock-controlled protein daywake n=1 Tax=Halyomorpha halys TaxID=286706 RepID=UPI0006D4CE21|nr:circadian clock-controlled protein-like [Halyomorpha halys]
MRSFLSLGIVCFIVGVGAKRLPDYIPTCKRNDPNFDKCVVDAVEVVRPYLVKGIPKIRVPSLEPLHIPQLSINRDLENIKVKANLKDLKVWGGNGFKINKFKSNLDKLSVEMSVTVPTAYVTSDYEIDGRLLVVPLKGKGIFSGNFTNISADVKGTGELVTGKKGAKYVNIKSLRIKAKVGDQVVKFVNTDDNQQNALITNTAANFVNQNRRQVLEIVTPIAEETGEALITQMANNLFKTIPFSELVPSQ